MPKPSLDDLDVEAGGDQQRGEVVPQVMEPEVVGQADLGSCGADGTFDRPGPAGVASQVTDDLDAVAQRDRLGEELRHLGRDRDRGTRGVGLQCLVLPLNQRRQRMLKLAVVRKPLPVDHPTAALAYRVKDLVARRTGRAAPVDEFRRTAPLSTGPTLGL